jgi:hypothetical protein
LYQIQSFLPGRGLLSLLQGLFEDFQLFFELLSETRRLVRGRGGEREERKGREREGGEGGKRGRGRERGRGRRGRGLLSLLQGLFEYFQLFFELFCEAGSLVRGR